MNMGKKRKSYPRSPNIKIKLDMTDNSIFKVKWKSPNDQKENTVDIRADKENYTLKIKDNH